MSDRTTLSRPVRLHKPHFYAWLAPPRLPPIAIVLLAVTVFAACTGRAPMLNSERIEATYGNYGIQVLAANDRERITSLYSTTDGLRTTRTYAEVRFAAPVPEAVREEHAVVIAGGSIGAVFQGRGWTVSKRNLRIDTERLDASRPDVARLMRIEPTAELALHEYALVVARPGLEIEYAVITERHHPDYLTEGDLRRIYGMPAKTAK